MGDLTDQVLNGFLCEGCGDIMPDQEEPGFPRRCPSCIAETQRALLTEPHRHARKKNVQKANRRRMRGTERMNGDVSL